jgi:hypothetical protein
MSKTKVVSYNYVVTDNDGCIAVHSEEVIVTLPAPKELVIKNLNGASVIRDSDGKEVVRIKNQGEFVRLKAIWVIDET